MSSAAIVANPKRDIDDSHHSSSVRSCEFCGSCTTPTWRRGPSGKGSLCNACGIKWRLKKRTSPVTSSNNKKENDASSSASNNNKKVKSKKLFSSPIPTIAKKTNNSSTSSSIKSIDRKPATNSSNNNGQQQLQQTNNKERPAINPDSNDKRYYCKFCDKTFASTHFKNSQQFGAHCSNCSRRPRGGNSNMMNDAPSSSHHDGDEDDDNYSDVEMNVDVESDYLEEDSTQHHHQQQQHALQQHHADDLLNHLLHVVANQLVEENELISIRGELAVIKEDMHIQKEQQQSSIVELRTQLHRDVEEISAMIAEDARQKQRVAAAQLCELDQYWREIHTSLEQHLYSSHTSVFAPSSPSALHQLSA